MTKQEFLQSDKPLVMLVSLNPATGKVLFDTYPFDTADSWKKTFEEDFPDMLHFYYKNPASAKELRRIFGLESE